MAKPKILVTSAAGRTGVLRCYSSSSQLAIPLTDLKAGQKAVGKQNVSKGANDVYKY